MESYYSKNREYILSRVSEKITCDLCGKKVSRGNFYAHKKSKHCQRSSSIRILDELRIKYNIDKDKYNSIKKYLETKYPLYTNHITYVVYEPIK